VSAARLFLVFQAGFQWLIRKPLSFPAALLRIEGLTAPLLLLPCMEAGISIPELCTIGLVMDSRTGKGSDGTDYICKAQRSVFDRF
jgi:hypothetical protein